MDDNNIDLHEQEEEEEALSLSDLPLTNEEPHHDLEDSPNFHHSRRSSSAPPDSFEFFSDHSSEMSHAEDIMFCGKLKPLNKQSLSNRTYIPSNSDEKLQSLRRRRSESMCDLKTSQCNGLSLDYKKLRRNSSLISETSEINRNSSSKSSAKSDMSVQKISRPRWYVLIFGLLKFPPEMDLRDIKNRQVRRNPAALVPSFDSNRKFPVNRSDRKSSWGVLRILSCKGHASVAVTASFGCMPQV